MGLYFRGIDPNLAESLKRTLNLRNFVETGTFHGKTSIWAAKMFTHVYTIEANKEYFDKASSLLNTTLNVTCILGDSSQLMARVLKLFTGEALIWLDAHWSRDLGYAKPDLVCPVLQEIAAIKEDGRHHAIMVDDARLFGIERGWPSLKDVKKALAYSDRSVFILNDILVSM